MKKFLKSMLAAAAAVVAVAPAVASVNIDGVTFNAGTEFITTSLWEKTLTTSVDTLEGVGVVNKVACSGCGGVTWQDGNNGTQLTYHFYGFAVDKWLDLSGTWHNSGDEGSGANTFAHAVKLVFNSGTINLYTDHTSRAGYTHLDPSANPNVVSPSLQAADIAAATDGNLWLSYAGVSTFDGLTGKNGTLFASAGSANNVHVGGAGFGYLNATSGLAFGNFHTQSYNVGGVIADVRFDSAYSNDNAGAWDLSGTASYKTNAIPEPASVALVGAALFAVGFSARRRKS